MRLHWPIVRSGCGGGECSALMGRLSLARERGRVRVNPTPLTPENFRELGSSRSKPLTFVLSPSPRGEAGKAKPSAARIRKLRKSQCREVISNSQSTNNSKLCWLSLYSWTIY